MIDQKIVMVDNRNIVRDIAMRIMDQTYAHEMARVGSFMDEAGVALSRITATSYLASLSGERQASFGQVRAMISDVITHQFCNHFPMVNALQIQQLKDILYNTIVSSTQASLEATPRNWDNCEVRQLALDTYVVVCTRTVSTSATQAPTGRVLDFPINASRMERFAHCGAM